MLKCWREQPLRRPKYEELIEDLEGQISEVSGIVSKDMFYSKLSYLPDTKKSRTLPSSKYLILFLTDGEWLFH